MSVTDRYAMSLNKISIRDLLANCLYEMSRFVRACAVEMHMEMSQQTFRVKIKRGNAGRDGDHLDLTPGRTCLWPHSLRNKKKNDLMTLTGCLIDSLTLCIKPFLVSVLHGPIAKLSAKPCCFSCPLFAWKWKWKLTHRVTISFKLHQNSTRYFPHVEANLPL